MRSGLDCMPGKQTNGRSHSCDWPSCSDRGAVTLLGFRFAAWPFPRGRRRLVMTQAVNLSRCRCSTQETVCCRKAPLSVVPLTAWLTKINRVMLRNWILHQERVVGTGSSICYHGHPPRWVLISVIRWKLSKKRQMDKNLGTQKRGWHQLFF